MMNKLRISTKLVNISKKNPDKIYPNNIVKKVPNKNHFQTRQSRPISKIINCRLVKIFVFEFEENLLFKNNKI